MQQKRCEVGEYQVYLLRIWRSGASEPWVVTLQSTKSRQRRGFTGLDAAFLFLHDQLEGEARAAGEPAPEQR